MAESPFQSPPAVADLPPLGVRGGLILMGACVFGLVSWGFWGGMLAWGLWRFLF